MGQLMECLVGDSTGTARLVAWTPNLLLGIQPGSTVHITGAKPDRRAEGRAYSIDETSMVNISGTPVTVPFTPLGSVADTGQYSVTGEVKTAKEPRSFTTKAGNPSWVRNICIGDETDELAVVLWGDFALQPVRPGDRVEIYHGSARAGRFGGIELGVGRGSVLRLPQEERRAISFTGTIIPGNGGTFIDDGNERYLIEGEYPAGAEIAVTGVLAGSRIIPETSVPAEKSPEQVAGRLAALVARLDSLALP
jgi:replication factor A1